jgi:hypothetical protein
MKPLRFHVRALVLLVLIMALLLGIGTLNRENRRLRSALRASQAEVKALKAQPTLYAVTLTNLQAVPQVLDAQFTSTFTVDLAQFQQTSPVVIDQALGQISWVYPSTPDMPNGQDVFAILPANPPAPNKSLPVPGTDANRP